MIVPMICIAVLVLTTGVAAGAPIGHRVTGHVAETVTCEGDAAATVVVLEPLERVTTTAADGTFAFDDVPDGDYTVVVAPGCSPSLYCYDPVPVSVRGADRELDICFETSSCPVERTRVEPARVRGGGLVEVSGRCYALHSGRMAQVLLDQSEVGTVTGDTSGGFRALFAVPIGSALGRHGVRIVSSGEQIEVGRGTLEVVGAVPICSGDCNADGTVRVDELVGGIALALGGAERPACIAAFCNADCGPNAPARRIAIDCLIRAVRNAVNNACPHDPCRIDADCDDGNPLTSDSCSEAGCENTCG
ncbi:MAG: hypothetical protein AB7V27_15285 [Candidatus Binatia bacterium]